MLLCCHTTHHSPSPTPPAHSPAPLIPCLRPTPPAVEYRKTTHARHIGATSTAEAGYVPRYVRLWFIFVHSLVTHATVWTTPGNLVCRYCYSRGPHLGLVVVTS